MWSFCSNEVVYGHLRVSVGLFLVFFHFKSPRDEVRFPQVYITDAESCASEICKACIKPFFIPAAQAFRTGTRPSFIHSASGLFRTQLRKGMRRTSSPWAYYYIKIKTCFPNTTLILLVLMLHPATIRLS